MVSHPARRNPPNKAVLASFAKRLSFWATATMAKKAATGCILSSYRLEGFKPKKKIQQNEKRSSCPTLQGKAAVVTGSTSGIGLAIATALAEAGADVMLNGLGSPAEIEAAMATRLPPRAARPPIPPPTC